MRFCFVPFSVLGCAVPLKATMLLSHSAAALDRLRHPRRMIDSPMRILSPRVSDSVRLVRWRRRPRGSFVVGFLISHVPGSRIGQLSQLGQDFLPATLMGLTFSFAAFLCFPGDDAIKRLGPTCRFSMRSPRVSSSRDQPKRVEHGAFGRGFWGLAPRSSRAVLFAGPAIAFVHRAGRIHLPLLPWSFSSLRFLPSVSGHHFWGHSARAFRLAR
jgi:hypothetical protein